MVLATGGCTCTGDALNVVSLLLDYASEKGWSPQPVTLRQNGFTKAIRRLLHGGEDGRNPECCPRQSWLMKPA